MNNGGVKVSLLRPVPRFLDSDEYRTQGVFWLPSESCAHSFTAHTWRACNEANRVKNAAHRIRGYFLLRFASSEDASHPMSRSLEWSHA